jgi:hypothetical protein
VIHERKRWSLQEEILKTFETALKRMQEEIDRYDTALRHGHLKDVGGYVDLKLEHIRYTCQKGMHGIYQWYMLILIFVRFYFLC